MNRVAVDVVMLEMTNSVENIDLKTLIWKHWERLTVTNQLLIPKDADESFNEKSTNESRRKLRYRQNHLMFITKCKVFID